MEEWYGFRIIRWDTYIPETRTGIISLTFQVMPGFDYTILLKMACTQSDEMFWVSAVQAGEFEFRSQNPWKTEARHGCEHSCNIITQGVETGGHGELLAYFLSGE